MWAPVFAFMPTFAMYSLNFIGVELENPFGSDDNDLPLEHFQHEMNSCLLMLLHPDTDLIAGLDDNRCKFDFKTLETELRNSHLEKEAQDEAEHHSHRSPPPPPPSGRKPRLTEFTRAVTGDLEGPAAQSGDPGVSSRDHPLR